MQTPLKTTTTSASLPSEKRDIFEFSEEEDDDNVETNDEKNESKKADSWKSKPDCWSDDVRMNALFSPFRSRDLNPLHYDNKLKFWKELIVAYCLEKNLMQFDQNYLETCFLRNQLKPKCFDVVLSSMLNDKTLNTREELLKPKPTLLSNVLNKVIWTPLVWSTKYLLERAQLNSYFYVRNENHQLNTSGSSNVLASPLSSNHFDLMKSQSSIKSIPSLSSVSKDEHSNKFVYVLVDLLEHKSKELLDTLQSHVIFRNVDSLISYEKICELVDDGKVAEHDLELILKYLQQTQKVIISEIEDRKLCKFTLNSARNVEQINEVELSYLNLKETETKIENEIGKLTSQIEQYDNDVRLQLKQNNKQLALKYLKKRKQLEKQLESKEGIQTNIQTLIHSIQQADTNKMAMDVYTRSVEALKEANKGLNVDKIDETICDLQDMINSNLEIEETLAKSPTIYKYNYDEKELNDELNELMAASEKVKKNLHFDQNASFENDASFNMDQILKNLPQVPDQTPKKSTNTASALLTTN